jgi:hypothetical protein
VWGFVHLFLSPKHSTASADTTWAARHRWQSVDLRFAAPVRRRTLAGIVLIFYRAPLPIIG